MAKSRKKKSGSKSRSRGGGGKRAMWKGSITFGLVNIPVRMYAAYKPHKVRFHLLHANDRARVHQELFCNREDKKIDRSDTVRGYEIAPGQHVVIRDEELDALAPEASRAIELVQFVKLSEIDPVYFDRPYYLIPEENARKAYWLFTEAVERSQKAAIVKFVMRDREYLGILRTLEHVVCLETMHFPDEIVNPADFHSETEAVKIGEKEIRIAETLIDNLTEPFHPGQLQDDYRKAVEALVRRKAEGKAPKIEKEAEEPEKPEVVDLMSALEASLSEAKKKGGKKKSKAA